MPLAEARRRGLALSLALGLAIITLAMVARADTLPTRKAGLWELKTTMDQGNGPQESSLKICISSDMEQQTVEASMLEHRENCSRYEIKAEGDTTIVEGECVFNNTRVNSRTEMKGDFKTAFQVKIESTSVRQGAAQSMAVRRQITQLGTYLGESCENLSPGEAKGQDGMKVYVQ